MGAKPIAPKRVTVLLVMRYFAVTKFDFEIVSNVFYVF